MTQCWAAMIHGENMSIADVPRVFSRRKQTSEEGGSRLADGVSVSSSPFPRGWLTGLTVLLGVLAPFLVVVLVLGTGEPASTFTRDITAIARVPPYYGFLSQLNIIVWASTCGICLLALFVLYSKGMPLLAGFMLSACALTGLVLFDDAFLFHETVAPHFGIPERFVELAIVVFGLVHVVLWRRMVLTRQNSLLVWAGLALGLSVGIDVLDEPITRVVGAWEYLLEDGLKWLGAVFWLGFHLRFAIDVLND